MKGNTYKQPKALQAIHEEADGPAKGAASEQDLRQRLIALQIRLNLSDNSFAKLLGVDAAVWSLSKLGRRPMRFSMVSGAARAFAYDPLIENAILRYLREAGPSRVAEHVQIALEQLPKARVGRPPKQDNGKQK